MSFFNITKFEHCISAAEHKQRLWVTFVNVVVWLVILGSIAVSMGIVLAVILFLMLMDWLLSEYHIRLLQATGSTVSERQWESVHRAAQEVCTRFHVKRMPRIIVLASGETNAFAVAFARRKVVVLLSSLLEGIVDDPAQLRFVLAHEICHSVLDHGARGAFELYKPAAYKQAREMTCDNAGLVMCERSVDAVTALKKICAGYRLSDRLNDAALIEESRQIYSGFTGWLVKQGLTHPPVGRRIENLNKIAASVGL